MIDFDNYILVEATPDFESKMKKLVKKATKLGLPPIQYKIDWTDRKIEEFRTDYDPKTRKDIFTPFEVVRVTIHGENPILNGWRLAASIDFEAGIGNVVNVVPGEEVDPKYRDYDNYCEHCKTKRVRNQTFVLKNVDGSETVVGRACLKDFLPNAKVEKLISAASFPKMIDDLMESCRTGFGRCTPVYEPVLVIALAIHAIKEYGFYMSQSKYAEMYEKGQDPAPTTTSVICGYLFNENAKYRYYPNASEFEEAAAMIEWAKTLDTSSDYNYNIVNLCKGVAVRSKYFGYLASVPAAYARANNLIKEKEIAKKASNYVGNVGDKVTVELTFKNFYTFATNYGYRPSTGFINKFVDAEGNVFVWSTGSGNDLEAGKTYKLKGTIKAHKEYKGMKETVLTRCKLI